ncbi:MAG: high-affinity iron transporter [Cognaticolwellia sp.]|jgi:high-affinity iron transporter
MPRILTLFALLISGSALASDAERGKQVYTANCMACHGTEGNGEGPAAMALTPKPSDFTDAAFWKDRSDEALASTIKTGKPGTSMAPFPQLNEEDMASLVIYLNTLKPKLSNSGS